MTVRTLNLEAPRALLLLLGMAQLNPFGPEVTKVCRSTLREIQRSASLNGWKQWRELEAQPANPSMSTEQQLILAAACLDAAGAWVVYRAFNGMPAGMQSLQPGPGLSGSDVVIRITQNVPGGTQP